MTNNELLDRDKKNIGAPVLSLLHTLKEKGLEGPVQTAQRNLYRIEGIITAMRLKGTFNLGKKRKRNRMEKNMIRKDNKPCNLRLTIPSFFLFPFTLYHTSQPRPEGAAESRLSPPSRPQGVIRRFREKEKKKKKIGNGSHGYMNLLKNTKLNNIKGEQHAQLVLYRNLRRKELETVKPL